MELLEDSVRLSDPVGGVDLGAVELAAAEQAARSVPGVSDMASYLATQVRDVSHRDVLGPLLDGSGASGVVVRRGDGPRLVGRSDSRGNGLQRPPRACYRSSPASPTTTAC